MKKLLVCLSQIVLVLIMSTMVYGAQDSSNDAQEFFKTERLYVDGFCLLGPDAISGGTAQYSNVKVDENSITIILENSYIKTVGSSTWEGFISYWGDRTLNIVIKGNNTMSTSKYDQCCYLNGGIYVSSIEKKGDVNVSITGDGTLNLENGAYLIHAEDSNINVSIEGVTIHSNLAGIYCGGTLSVKKSKIFIKNSLDEHPHLPAGRSNALVCFKYVFDNEHIYVGKGKLEQEIKTEELFENVNIRDTEMYQNKVNYDWVLLSDEVADLRKYNPVPEVTTVKAPPKAVIKKVAVKKISSKKVKISLKKIRGVKGYQVAVYNLKKKSVKNRNAIIKKFVKKTNVTVTSKKLKNKRTLYVKVRAYKLDGKRKIYGKWSKAKKVKIKK